LAGGAAGARPCAFARPASKRPGRMPKNGVLGGCIGLFCFFGFVPGGFSGFWRPMDVSHLVGGRSVL
jgi:hypothetical protein